MALRRSRPFRRNPRPEPGKWLTELSGRKRGDAKTRRVIQQAEAHLMHTASQEAPEGRFNKELIITMSRILFEGTGDIYRAKLGARQIVLNHLMRKVARRFEGRQNNVLVNHFGDLFKKRKEKRAEAVGKIASLLRKKKARGIIPELQNEINTIIKAVDETTHETDLHITRRDFSMAFSHATSKRHFPLTGELFTDVLTECRGVLSELDHKIRHPRKQGR